MIGGYGGVNTWLEERAATVAGCAHGPAGVSRGLRPSRKFGQTTGQKRKEDAAAINAPRVSGTTRASDVAPPLLRK